MNNLHEPLHDLAVFAAVAEAEGFSRAARRLSLSKAAVSTAVQRLETRLGVRLFQRTTRKLHLTAAGASALPHIQRALLAARDALQAASEMQTSPRGVLRVNAPMSFGLLHLTPALGAFARAFPEIEVDLVLDDRVLDLVEGGFDLALRIGALADSNLVVKRVGTSRNVIVAHPDYLSQVGTPEQPADLAEHAALLYSLSQSGPRWTLSRGSHSETVRLKPRLTANSSLALHQALLQGLGLARVPLFVVGTDLKQGRLVRVLPEWQLPDQGIFTLQTTREHVPVRTRAFQEFLSERFREPAYWENGLGPECSLNPPR